MQVDKKEVAAQWDSEELEMKYSSSEQRIAILVAEMERLNALSENDKAKLEKFHDDMQEDKKDIAALREEIAQYQMKVEERDKMIDRYRKVIQEPRYFKSPEKDEVLCEEVCKLVQYFTVPRISTTTSDYPDINGLKANITQLEHTVQELTEENNALHSRLPTHQSPTASLIPLSIAALQEALFNETEMEELKKLKEENEMYQTNGKRQSQAILGLKKELEATKVLCGYTCRVNTEGLTLFVLFCWV